jgi:hypothetical protein
MKCQSMLKVIDREMKVVTCNENQKSKIESP